LEKEARRLEAAVVIRDQRVADGLAAKAVRSETLLNVSRGMSETSALIDAAEQNKTAEEMREQAEAAVARAAAAKALLAALGLPKLALPEVSRLLARALLRVSGDAAAVDIVIPMFHTAGIWGRISRLLYSAASSAARFGLSAIGRETATPSCVTDEEAARSLLLAQTAAGA
jgi:hypothetical protein